MCAFRRGPELSPGLFLVDIVGIALIVSMSPMTTEMTPTGSCPGQLWYSMKTDHPIVSPRAPMTRRASANVSCRWA